MSDDTSTDDAQTSPDASACVENVTSLGTSPAGESFKITRRPSDADEDDHHLIQIEVLKKLTRDRLRPSSDFKRHFEALRRLEHPSLCSYYEFYPGEEATRLTRQWVPGIPLDDYLLQPITEAEQAELESSSAQEEQGEDDETQRQTTNAGDETLEVVDDSSSDASTPSENLNTADDSTTSPRQLPSDTTDDRPSTLEIPESLIEDSDAADRALDLLILRLQRLIPDLVDGLEFLHRFRHPHGHLTPSNIIVTDDENVVITDYGLYPNLHILPAQRRRYRSYMPPDVDTQNLDPSADLYALGAILFEILAGRPYGANRRTETPDGTTTGPTFSPIYLSEIVPHCPASWVDLIHALLAPDPDDRPSLDEVRTQLAQSEARSVNIPAAVVEDPDPLHGRRQTLEHLADRSKRCAQERHLAFILIDGDTGVGKTSLVNALARQATQRGWIVCRGHFSPQQTSAYQGWNTIIDRMAEITDDLPDRPRQRLASGRQQASRLFPRLLEADRSPPDVSHHAAVSGLRRWITGLSDQRPILICFDDLHRAGLDALRLLADIAERPRSMRVMIVATWPSNDDADHPLWTEFDAAPTPIEAIEIKPFSPLEAQDYLEARAPFLDNDQRQHLIDKSDRNPLLLDELLHEWMARSTSPRHDDQESWLNDLPTATDPDTRRQTLRLLLEHRLDDLGRPHRLVLQLLVVAASPLSTDLLDRSLHQELGTQTADLVSAQDVCTELCELRLLRPARSPRSEQASSFTVVHDLARKIIFDTLGQDHHARLYGLLADGIADDDSDDDLRFEYLMRAGRGDEAHRAATLAARSALFRYAFHRASRIWQWLDERDAIETSDLHRAASALARAGHFEPARVHLHTLLDQRRDDRPQWFCQLVLLELRAGRRDCAIDALDDALDSVHFSYRSPGLGERATEPFQRLATITSRWADATSMATSEELDASSYHRAELFHLALDTAPLLESRAQSRLTIAQGRLALKSASPHLLARDRLWMIAPPWHPLLIRQGPKLTRWLDQAHSLAQRGDHERLPIAVLEMQALVAHHGGDFDGVDNSLRQARSLLHEGHADAPLLHTRLDLWTIDHLLTTGAVDEAGHRVQQLLHRLRHHPWMAALARLAAADHCLLTGSLDRCELHLDAIDDFLDGHQDCLLHIWMMDRLTALNIARGRPEVAVAQWDLLLDRVYSRSLRRQSQARWLIHSNLARALCAQLNHQQHLDLPDSSASLGRLRGVLRQLRDLEEWLGVVDTAYLHRLHAHYFLLSDKPSRARHHLDQAQSPWPDDQDAPPLVRLLNRAARAHWNRHRDEQRLARELQDGVDEQSQRMGYFIPQVLQGWPTPDHHARLQLDGAD